MYIYVNRKEALELERKINKLKEYYKDISISATVRKLIDREYEKIFNELGVKSEEFDKKMEEKKEDK